MLEVGLIVLMMAIIGGGLWLMKWWNKVVSRRAGSETSSPPARTGFRAPVLRQPVRVIPQEPIRTEPPNEPLTTLPIMDDAALIKFLAELRTPEGDYRFSANRIRDIVGGADAVVKSQVARYRPKPPAPKPAAHLERPANGW